MMSSPILQTNLPAIPWADPRLSRLPGMLPLHADDWLVRDEAFAGQMAERDRLIATRRDEVLALRPEAGAAARELLALILTRLAHSPGYQTGPAGVTRPDGVTVVPDPGNALRSAGALIQEDLCILTRAGAEHVLSGAILCFPASWTLAQKIGRPLVAIHHPVAAYTGDLARRVQRLFDAIRPEQGLWRMNALSYDDPTLFQPRREGEARPKPVAHRYMRCERQCLIRLPQTQAVVFSIHTYVVERAGLPPGTPAPPGMA